MIYGTQTVNKVDSVSRILTSNRYLFQIDIENNEYKVLFNFAYVGEQSFISPSILIEENGEIGVNFIISPHPVDLWSLSPEGLQYFIDNYTKGEPINFDEISGMTASDGTPLVQRIAGQLGVDSWGNETIYIDGELNIYVAGPDGIYRFYKQ